MVSNRFNFTIEDFLVIGGEGAGGASIGDGFRIDLVGSMRDVFGVVVCLISELFADFFGIIGGAFGVVVC